MHEPPASNPAGCLLGIEGGGTRSVAILASADGRRLQRTVSGPGNLQLLTDAALVRLLRSFRVPGTRVARIAIGLAGARTEADRRRIRRAARRVWPGAATRATNDLETALAAAPKPSGRVPEVRVLVLSGTGSCCFGRNAAGESARAGGWGHLLGDRGSGFQIGLNALRQVLEEFDATGRWPPLGQRLLQRLLLNEPEHLIPWAQQATKDEVAALAVEVCASARRGDSVARGVLKTAAAALARDALACAARLASRKEPVQFIFAGSMLLRQPTYARYVESLLRSARPRAITSRLAEEGAWGAVQLAAQPIGPIPRGWTAEVDRTPAPDSELKRLSESPTEQRNPRSLDLDRLSVGAAVDLMLSEERFVLAGLRRERRSIVRSVSLIARALRRRGRLFYVGAGTSGRLGVLDASECPPTFRTPPEMVQGIMAGGAPALWQAVEGAEDDREAGARAVCFRGVRKGDVVVGIAASGRTPFVWGALEAADARGADTILLSFNPAIRSRRGWRPRLLIAANVGPELLTGSTRLKSGTATKLVLNMFTTLALVRLGKVIGNLMVDLNASNTKLRDRAMRITRELTGADEASAEAALRRSGWRIPAAVRSLQRRTRRRR